jgi:hypothetical protein
MKATLKLVGLAVIIFLSSCSNDMLIVKRKYNKGYYVNTGSGKVKQQETAAAQNNKKNVAEEQAILPAEVAVKESEMPVTASVATTVPAAVKRNTAPAKVKTVAEYNNVSLTKKEQKKNTRAQKKAAADEIQKSKKLSSGGDANLVLLVILAIFPIFSLIAMYVHDGHSITTNFWINLLLHFTVIGYAIFGVLVVLNIVDLS